MEKLKDLYHKRQVFAEFNTPIPEELTKQIREAEIELINSVSETVLGYLPDEIEIPTNCSIIFGFEYRDGKLIKAGSSLNATLDGKFDYTKDILDDEADEENDETDETNDRKRSKSVGFTVKFADGKTIKYPTAQRTMIETLRYMGLERASKYRDEMFKGFPLIGKEQRTTEGKRWQRMIDGWWIYINMGNDRKITCLKGIANMLNIGVEIILDDEECQSAPVESK